MENTVLFSTPLTTDLAKFLTCHRCENDSNRVRHEGPMETLEPVQTLIHEVRGQRVILDSDLARIYGVVVRP